MEYRYIPLIIIAIILVFLAYSKINIFETMETPMETMENVFAVGNAFTGLECINDNLPLYSINNDRTITVLGNASGTPLYRNDLKIPQNIICRANVKTIPEWKNDRYYNQGDTVMFNRRAYTAKTAVPVSAQFDITQWTLASDLNTFVSKDGIRQLPGGQSAPNTRDVFNKLSSEGYTQLKCEPVALSDVSHYCKKIYDSFDEWCNTLDPLGKKNTKGCSQDTASAANKTASVASNASVAIIGGVSVTKFSNEVITGTVSPQQISTCQNRDCVRNRPSGLSMTVCKDNCKNCGKTKC